MITIFIIYIVVRNKIKKIYKSLVLFFLIVIFSDISNEITHNNINLNDCHSLCYFIMDLQNVYLIKQIMIVQNNK